VGTIEQGEPKSDGKPEPQLVREAQAVPVNADPALTIGVTATTATTTTTTIRTALGAANRQSQLLALAYQILVGSIGGGLLGLALGYVVLVDDATKKIAGLGASTAFVAGATALFRRLPDPMYKDDPRKVDDAKRRVAAIALICTLLGMALFYEEAISGHTPFQIDASVQTRIDSLERKVQNLVDTYSVNVYREDRVNQPPGMRRWWRIPTAPQQPYAIQAEVSGSHDAHWIELVVTDETGKLLGGRLVQGSEPPSITITSGSAWYVNVGIRWWTDSASAAPTIDADLRNQDSASALVRVTSKPNPASLQFMGDPATTLTLDHGSFRTGGKVGADARSNLESSCGGENMLERVYQLNVPDGGWLTVSAESPGSVALYLLQKQSRSSVPFYRELACDRNATADTAGASNLRSTITAEIPPGDYYIVADGLGSRQQSLTLNGTVTTEQAMFADDSQSTSSAIQIGSDVVHARIDLLAMTGRQPACGSKSPRAYRDIPIHVETKGTYRASVVPAPEYAVSPRLPFESLSTAEHLPFDLQWIQPKQGPCASVDARPLEPGQDATLRLISRYPDGSPDVGGIELKRLDAPEDIAKLCKAKPSALGRLTSNHSKIWKGNLAAFSFDAGFAAEQCPATTTDIQAATDGPTQAAQFQLAEDSDVLVTFGAPWSSASTQQRWLYLIKVSEGGSETACNPVVLACTEVDDLMNVYSLRAGTYDLVLAGTKADDRSAFSFLLRRLARAASNLPAR
jgi:hypothetical protein